MKALKTLAAGCVVYLAVAACSAVGASNGPLGSGGGAGATAGGSGGAAGQVGGAGGGLLDSGLDALADALGDVAADVIDPVDAADAAPMPTVVTAQCDKTFRAAGTGYDTLYAEASFSGATVNDLAAVRVVLNYAEAPQIPGYTAAASIPQLRPGFAAVLCGYDLASSVIPSSVTFILP